MSYTTPAHYPLYIQDKSTGADKVFESLGLQRPEYFKMNTFKWTLKGALCNFFRRL